MKRKSLAERAFHLAAQHLNRMFLTHGFKPHTVRAIKAHFLAQAMRRK